MLHQIKSPQFFFTDLGLQKTVLNPLANGKFKDFARPLSVFQVFSKQFFFQELFKTAMYIQVLFKQVQTLYSYEISTI